MPPRWLLPALKAGSGEASELWATFVFCERRTAEIGRALTPGAINTASRPREKGSGFIPHVVAFFISRKLCRVGRARVEIRFNLQLSVVGLCSRRMGRREMGVVRWELE